VADALSIPVYKTEKKRDEATGKLSGFSVEPLPSKGRFLLVDDICDRGGTFLGLAEASGLPKERLDLFVSHGVFSHDATETLPEKFGHIYTTNSYDPLRHLDAKPELFDRASDFTRFDIIRLLLSKIK